jgi:serine/threonine protein kinase
MAAEDFHGWTKMGDRLGVGGQSEVFLVRSPKQQLERQNVLSEIQAGVSRGELEKLGNSLRSFANLDSPSELGALKVFKIAPKGTSLEPPPGFEPIQRLKNEISALKEGFPGLPKLLDYDEDQRWIITEYFPEGTFEHQPLKYRGRVRSALKAFRSLVQTVAAIHAKNYVHRDIKPANVFIRNDGLVLGDFGIVYIPDTADRVTRPDERVGPRDYMPDWGNLGARLENVQPNFDVYMLGKLLWSMVDGRSRLPREHHRNPKYDFDLTRTFPNDPHMHIVNRILDKCVVEHPSDCRLSADDLLSMVDKFLLSLDQGGQLLTHGVPRPCHVCGVGFYQFRLLPNNLPDKPIGLRLWAVGTGESQMWSVHPWACDNCGHVALFTQAPPSGN